MKRWYEDHGWFAMRAPASLGVCDLVALKKGNTPLMIEVKANVGNLYKNFQPADRRELAEAAEKAGANALLAHWPPRGHLTLIGSEHWPQ